MGSKTREPGGRLLNLLLQLSRFSSLTDVAFTYIADWLYFNGSLARGYRTATSAAITWPLLLLELAHKRSKPLRHWFKLLHVDLIE